MSAVEVAPVAASDLREPMRLLEDWLRDGEPVPEPFLRQLQRQIEAGDLEVLAARLENRPVGVLTLLFRPNISLGAPFASIEDLYVLPEFRLKGLGRALLHAAQDRCTHHEISYLEAQVETPEARAFYEASGYEKEAGVRVFSRSLPLSDRPGEKLKADG